MADLARFLNERFRRQLYTQTGHSVEAPEKIWKQTENLIVNQMLEGTMSGADVDQYASAAGILADAYLNPSQSIGDKSTHY